jgi:hypothetical protein
MTANSLAMILPRFSNTDSGRGTGSQLFLACQFAAAATALLIAGAFFRLRFRRSGLTGPSSIRQLRRGGRARAFDLADRALEGRAFARHVRHGKAARGRVLTDGAQWKSRGQIA